MIPVGISTSTYILVGNSIGSGNAKKSKFYAKMCIASGMVWAFLSVVVLIMLK